MGQSSAWCPVKGGGCISEVLQYVGYTLYRHNGGSCSGSVGHAGCVGCAGCGVAASAVEYTLNRYNVCWICSLLGSFSWDKHNFPCTCSTYLLMQPPPLTAH